MTRLLQVTSSLIIAGRHVECRRCRRCNWGKAEEDSAELGGPPRHMMRDPVSPAVVRSEHSSVSSTMLDPVSTSRLSLMPRRDIEAIRHLPQSDTRRCFEGRFLSLMQGPGKEEIAGDTGYGVQEIPPRCRSAEYTLP